MAETGTFRAALFYRLDDYKITLPPLRERIDDISFLAPFFLEKHQKEGTYKGIKEFSQNAMGCLLSYHWPGNVRRLESCIKNAIMSSKKDKIIRMSHLPKHVLSDKSHTTAEPVINSIDGKVAQLYPDNDKRARARIFLERWEKVCQEYPSDKKVTLTDIANGTNPPISQKAISQSCRKYGDVMLAFVEEFPRSFPYLRNNKAFQKSCMNCLALSR